MGEAKEGAPQPESQLSREFLVATFTDPKFVAHMADLTHHAHLNFAEGTFVVQRKNGKPVVHDVVNSPRTRSYEDRVYSTRGVLNIYKSVSSSDLKFREKEPLTFMDDVVVTVHSHPIRVGQPLDDVLRPSTVDLEGWQQLRGALKQPYLLQGIIVPYKGAAHLLLYQLDPNGTEDLYWQQYDSSESGARMLRYMKESGIRVAILKMDMKTRTFTEQELAKLDQFVV